MKKIIIICILLPVAIVLTGCVSFFNHSCFSVKSISKQRSKENFKNYMDTLVQVMDRYSFKLDEESTYKDMSFSFDGNVFEVSFNNNALDSQDSGSETFTIYYYISENSDFNLDAFTESVNSVSGKKISKEYVEKFLSDPEIKHLPSRYNNLDSKEDSGVAIHKFDFLNFGEDWSLEYVLSTDGEEYLRMWGLTINGTR